MYLGLTEAGRPKRLVRESFAHVGQITPLGTLSTEIFDQNFGEAIRISKIS
jgi:hypothetical protein